MPQIKIRIGATKDRSVDAVFGDIEKRSIRTAAVIKRSLEMGLRGGMSAGTRGGASGGVRAQISAEEKERIAAARREDAAQVRLIRQRARMEHSADLAAHKERMGFLLQEQRAKLTAQRNVARAAQRNSDRERRNFAERTSHRATRFLTPNAPIGSMATRLIGDFARGAGVDFSIGGSVNRAVSLEAQATALSNSGYQATSTGLNGQRVDPRALAEQANAVGIKYGLQASDALGGLAEFQKITGDLATGRAMLDDMAKLSAATGTNIADMAAAAANVSNGLGDMPNKAAVIDKVMRTIAGQGKLGAVEISDLATQMARVAASAGMFTGDRAANIEKMGALAQIARATGGAPSAAEAARSVVGFSNTLKKGARIKEFEAAGVNVFADKGKTEFKDPIQLIKESLAATGGDLQKMNLLFMDVIGARGVAGLSQTYSRAGGGEAGQKAVDEELSRYLKGAALSEEEINESANRAAETSAAKAARFQNQLDQIVEKVSRDLIPALEKAAPKVLEFAEVVGRMASWTVENPGQAIVLAITASIARAGIETALRTGIERLLLPANMGGYDRKAGFGAGVGVLGNATAALMIASFAVGSFQVGQMIVDQFFDETAKNRGKELANDIGNEALGAQLRQLLEQGDLTGAKDLAEKRLTQDKLDVTKTEAQLDKSGFQEAFEAFFAGGHDGILGWRKDRAEAFEGRDAQTRALLEEQKREVARSNALLERIVDAINAKGIGGEPTPGRQSSPIPGN